MSKKQGFITVMVFILCTAGITVFAFWPSSEKKPQEQHRTRIIIPSTSANSDDDFASAENFFYEDGYSFKAPLGEGELAISVLNFDFNNDAIEEQIVVYRSVADAENPVSIALFAYDERSRAYRRLWNIPVAATMPATVSLQTLDLLGDRSDCIIVTGMNTQGEHTMTVFRKDPREDMTRPFAVIAGIRIGGFITVQETERSLAYQQGIARGQPFVISAYGRDGESNMLMDRVEISYIYNTASGIYQQGSITRIPGSQIEERRLREILTGEPKVFEEFINDLWYHVSPQGTIDRGQYLYFDPANREIIFFGDGTQQVFTWHNSNSTRYGLYISSQNISVTTLRRSMDIELESLDSIRIRVIEDVRLKIYLSASWDGSYRRAGTAMRTPTEEKTIRPYTEALYDSSLGRLRFYTNGEYELSSSGTLVKGRYAFFRVGGNDLLELRPVQNGVKSGNGESRFIYNCTSMDTEGAESPKSENLSLSRVRLGTSGIQELHEAPIILTKAQ
jgi:hypothetical protein